MNRLLVTIFVLTIFLSVEPAAHSVMASSHSQQEEDSNYLSFLLNGVRYNLKVKDISLSKSNLQQDSYKTAGRIRISISAEEETSVRKTSVHLFFDLDEELKPSTASNFGLNLNEIIKSSTTHEVIRISISNSEADYARSTSEKRVEYKLKGKGEAKITKVTAGKGVALIGRLNGKYSGSHKEMEIHLTNGEFKIII